MRPAKEPPVHDSAVATVSCSSQVDHRSLEGGAVRINPLPDHRADGGLGLGEDGGWSDEAKVHFGGTRAVTDFEVAALFELLANAFFDLTFADASETVNAPLAKRGRGQHGAEFGQDVINKHRP